MHALTVDALTLYSFHLQHKATHLTIQCKDCRGTKTIACRPGLGGAFLPGRCDLSRPPPGGESCGLNPFIVVPDSSKFVDQQTLKLQVGAGHIPCAFRGLSLLQGCHGWACGNLLTCK